MALPLLALGDAGGTAAASLPRAAALRLIQDDFELEKAKSLLELTDDMDDSTTEEGDATEEDDDDGFVEGGEFDEFDEYDPFTIESLASYNELEELARRLDAVTRQIDRALFEMGDTPRFADEVAVLSAMQISVDSQTRIVKRILRAFESPSQLAPYEPYSPPPTPPVLEGEVRGLVRELSRSEFEESGGVLTKSMIMRLSVLMSVLTVLVYQLYSTMMAAGQGGGQRGGQSYDFPVYDSPQVFGAPAAPTAPTAPASTQKESLSKTKLFIHRALKQLR